MGCLSLIRALKLYLTDFLKCIFLRENAKNRAFSGGEKLKAAAVYQTVINQGASLWKSGLCSRYLYPSPGRFAATLSRKGRGYHLAARSPLAIEAVPRRTG
jgi:hypothetical protein